MSRITRSITSKSCLSGKEGIEIEIRYVDLAKKARDQVQELDEPYRSIAYETILRDLIQEAKRETPAPVKSKRKMSSPESAENAVEAFLTNPVNAAPYSKLFSSRGKLLEKCLGVLKLARDELGVDGLTAPQVSEILVKKFRVSKVHRQSVNRDLGAATEFVTRLKTDDGYKYLLMTAGEQRLEEVAGQLR